MALTREQLKRAVVPRETVEVPELGGEVIVRGLRLSERLELAASASAARQFSGLAQLLAWCVVDEDGQPLMSVAEWEDWGGQCADAAVRLLEVAHRLSGLYSEPAKKK